MTDRFFSTIRTLAVGFVVLCLGCSRDSSPASNSGPVAVRPDDLQGKWKLVRMERNGSEMDISVNYATRGLKFADDRTFLLNTATGTEADTLLVVTAYDPAASPKQFDLTAHKGHPNAGKIIPCIYALSGDELLIMMGDNDKGRPATFDTSKVVGIEKQTYQRMGK